VVCELRDALLNPSPAGDGRGNFVACSRRYCWANAIRCGTEESRGAARRTEKRRASRYYFEISLVAQRLRSFTAFAISCSPPKYFPWFESRSARAEIVFVQDPLRASGTVSGTCASSRGAPGARCRPRARNAARSSKPPLCQTFHAIG
jgi:hypothetical protein